MMTHIKNYLPSSKKELLEATAKIKTTAAIAQFKIGDQVRFLHGDLNEKWTITSFTTTADNEPVVLLESDTFATYAHLPDIKFYYH